MGFFKNRKEFFTRDRCNKASVIAAGFFILFMESGVRQILNVFVKPIEDHFKCSRYMATLLIVVLPNASSLMSGPLVAIFYQMCGARIGITVGSIVTAIGFIGAAFTPSIYRMIAYSLFIGIGCGMMRNAIISVQCEYFSPKSRMAVLSFISVGPGIGIFVFPRLLVHIFDALSWQSALIVIAVLYLICSVIGLFISKQPSNKRNTVAAVFGLKVWKHPGFIFHQIASFCASSVSIVYLSHTIAWMRHENIPDPEVIYSYNGIASIVGRCLFTALLTWNKIPIGILIIFSYIFGQLSIPLAAFCHDDISFIIENAAAGLGFGIYQTCLGPYLVALVGPESLSNAYGYTNLFNGLAVISSLNFSSIYMELFPHEKAEFHYIAIIAVLSVIFSAISSWFMKRIEDQKRKNRNKIRDAAIGVTIQDQEMALLKTTSLTTHRKSESADLRDAVREYFDECDKQAEPATLHDFANEFGREMSVELRRKLTGSSSEDSYHSTLKII